MSKNIVTPQQVFEAVETLGSINRAAAHLGIARSTAQARYREAMDEDEDDQPYKVEPVPSSEIPLDELKRRRFEDFDRKIAARQAKRMIQIDFKSNDPIGIGWFGDPHLDDDGTDLRQVYEHADIVRNTPGLYGANIGDNTNLWIGRLMRLYAEQTTKASEGWRLTQDFIQEVRDWLLLVWGNHDHWQMGSATAADPLHALAKAHVPVADPYDVRVQLNFPNGRSVRFWMRHDFAGHSQWNELHGIMKAAKMGARFNAFIAGHKHCSGHHAEYNAESNLFWHAIRSAGYKKIDSHADALGFQDGNVFQCPVTIIDPLASNPSQLLKVEYDPRDGADRLTWLRRRRGSNEHQTR